jgi:hypothetical protein
MSITGPLHPEQLTRGETLDEVCVGPLAERLPSSKIHPLFLAEQK